MSVFESFKGAIWLAKINRRDQEAFSKCYDFYAPKIHRHAFYRLGSKELAEDVTSEVFTKTWEFLTESANNKIKNLRAFLYRVANNLIIDHYRAKGRQPILINEAMERNLGDGGSGAERLGSRLELAAVLENLEKLSRETREILIWRYVDDLSINEVAELAGRTKNAIYVAIHRGLKELRKTIKS